MRSDDHHEPDEAVGHQERDAVTGTASLAGHMRLRLARHREGHAGDGHDHERDGVDRHRRGRSAESDEDAAAHRADGEAERPRRLDDPVRALQLALACDDRHERELGRLGDRDAGPEHRASARSAASEPTIASAAATAVCAAETTTSSRRVSTRSTSRPTWPESRTTGAHRQMNIAAIATPPPIPSPARFFAWSARATRATPSPRADSPIAADSVRRSRSRTVPPPACGEYPLCTCARLRLRLRRDTERGSTRRRRTRRRRRGSRHRAGVQPNPASRQRSAPRAVRRTRS